MDLHVGTSGFAEKHWKGGFYPEKLPDREMLAFYASRFDAVEINNTFYRFPTPSLLAVWAAQVPPDFRFAIKVPQRITHVRRLRNVDRDLGFLVETVSELGGNLGPLLFQLPPRMPLDLPALEGVTAQLPPQVKAVFEFRDARWHCEEVYRLLGEQRCAVCFNDSADPPLQQTTEWGYVRARRESYSEADLAGLAEQVLAQPWREAFVFFKHETADSPELARRWLAMARG